MSCQSILRLFTKISYYEGLAIGLTPAPYDSRRGQFRKSRLYLIYSAVLHIVIVVGAPYTHWHQSRDGNQLRGHRVLQVTGQINSYIRMLSFLAISTIIWCNRQSMLQLYKEYWELMRRHASVLPTGGVYAPTRRTQRIVIVLFVTTHVISVGGMFYTQGEFSGEMFAERFWHILNMAITAYVEVPSFFIILLHCHLFEQFKGINLRLDCLLDEVRRRTNNHYVAVLFKLPKIYSEELDHLRAAHFEIYRLTLRIFRFSQGIYVFILIRAFYDSIATVHGLAVTVFFRGTGDFTVGMFYGFATVLVRIVQIYNSIFEPLQTLLDACNDTGKELRGYNEFVQLRFCRKFQLTLDRFADHLRSHKLYFDVCGLFRFDQRNAVTCCFVVLVNFTVLLQFDMEFHTETTAVKQVAVK